MAEKAHIPKGASEEEKKALRHSGGHGEGHEGRTGQRADASGDYNLPKHTPIKTERYSGQRRKR